MSICLLFPLNYSLRIFIHLTFITKHIEIRYIKVYKILFFFLFPSKSTLVRLLSNVLFMRDPRKVFTEILGRTFLSICTFEYGHESSYGQEFWRFQQILRRDNLKEENWHIFKGTKGESQNKRGTIRMGSGRKDDFRLLKVGSSS